jgi:phage/plasmid-like protein (TIGR03299 family)
MSHEVEQMVYTQDTPWHGIGDYLGEMDGVRVEDLRSSHPIYFSALNSEAVQTASGLTVPDLRAIIRAHDGRVVGAGRKQLVQGVTSPARVMQAVGNILGDKAQIHTAGFLRDGSRMFVLCKLPDSVRVKGTDDKIQQYLNVTVAFDGTMSLCYLHTPVRVVCANTQQMALSQAGDSTVKVKQTRNAEDRRIDAEEMMRESFEFTKELQVKLDILASTQLADNAANEIVAQIMGKPSFEELSTRAEANAEEIKRLAVEGTNADDAQLLKQFEGTAYALWQGVTAYADHGMVVRGARTADKQPETLEERSKVLDSIWFGAAKNLKDKAWKIMEKNFIQA